MNVGYFSVPFNSNEAYINIEELKKFPVVRRTNFLRHVRFPRPVSVLMDGKQRVALIKLPD